MQERLRKIHDTSMTILEKVGIRLYHPKIIEILKLNNIQVKDSVAYFSRDQIMAQVEKAPGQFTVYARNPKYDMVIGGGRSQYAGGYGCPGIIESDGLRRNATMTDYIRFVQLIQQSQGFRLNGGILVQPTDIPVHQAPLLMTYATMCLSDKCIMGQPGTAAEVENIMEMVGILFGGKESLVKKPRILTLVNTLSPLQIDRNSLETISIHARYEQPVVICAGVMTGTTSPMTLAGSIAQGNAETLAGIAIAQMIRPGTPVVMAINTTPVDMRTGGVNVGSPAQALAVKYCAGLAQMYGLPCRCGGSITNANGAIAQSGYESMLSMFVSLQEKVDLIIHSAGIVDGYSAMSYEKFIVDLEIIRLVEYYLKDMPMDENALALEAIQEVGWKGQYLTHSHTMKNCRNEAWISEITVTGPLKNAVSPHEAMMEKIGQKIDSMLKAYEQTTLDNYSQQYLDGFLKKNGVSQALLNSISGQCH